MKLPWDTKKKFPVTGEFWDGLTARERTGGLSEEFLKAGKCESLFGEND